MTEDYFITFAGFPYISNLSKIYSQIAIVGIPYGSHYQDELVHSSESPGCIRQESNHYPEDSTAWDFDLNGTLKEICGDKVIDCGDLPVKAENSVGNQEIIRQAISEILETRSVPVILGGDDSIPIPVMAAYEDQEPFYVLQMDAHIDWRDEVRGVRDGYSSTMRRASEMPWVKSIIQVGARGVGSARREEYEEALAIGAHLITASDFHHYGIKHVLEMIPKGSRCFLTIDFDVLDPSIMPAVGAPTPGGLYYQETIDLIQALSQHCALTGVCLVELVPSADLNHLGAITAMRIAWNVIGSITRELTKD
jgi:agmatinase